MIEVTHIVVLLGHEFWQLGQRSAYTAFVLAAKLCSHFVEPALHRQAQTHLIYILYAHQVLRPCCDNLLLFFRWRDIEGIMWLEKNDAVFAGIGQLVPVVGEFMRLESLDLSARNVVHVSIAVYQRESQSCVRTSPLLFEIERCQWRVEYVVKRRVQLGQSRHADQITLHASYMDSGMFGQVASCRSACQLARDAVHPLTEIQSWIMEGIKQSVITFPSQRLLEKCQVCFCAQSACKILIRLVGQSVCITFFETFVDTRADDQKVFFFVVEAHAIWQQVGPKRHFAETLHMGCCLRSVIKIVFFQCKKPFIHLAMLRGKWQRQVVPLLLQVSTSPLVNPFQRKEEVRLSHENVCHLYTRLASCRQPVPANNKRRGIAQIQKKRGLLNCRPSHTFRRLALPTSSGTSNAEAHADMREAAQRILNEKTQWGLYIHIPRTSTVALISVDIQVCETLKASEPKRQVNALSICVPTPAASAPEYTEEQGWDAAKIVKVFRCVYSTGVFSDSKSRHIRQGQEIIRCEVPLVFPFHSIVFHRESLEEI